MATRVAPLPNDVSAMSVDEKMAALRQRRVRIDELMDGPASKLNDEVLLEAQSYQDDIARLTGTELPPRDRSVRHPGFPTTTHGSINGSELGHGRVEGLGAEFLKELGKNRGGLQAALDGTSGGATMPSPFFDNRMRTLPQRQLFIRSLIPTRQVNTDKVDYIRQTVFTNLAAAVAPGALKPTSTITAERVEAPIRVVAHVSEALDRMMLADYDQLMSFVDNQLRLGVLLAEEDQLLNGSGSGVNLTGILNTSGIQTQAAGSAGDPDSVMGAITKIRLAYHEPDAIVMHPNDWLQFATLRTADGVYIWGSPADEARPNMWGLPVVTSPVITEGTALVGSFGTAAEVFQREGARITWAETGLGDSAGQELFTRNQVRARGESRIGLAVVRPDAFCKVTGL